MLNELRERSRREKISFFSAAAGQAGGSVQTAALAVTCREREREREREWKKYIFHTPAAAVWRTDGSETNAIFRPMHLDTLLGKINPLCVMQYVQTRAPVNSYIHSSA